MTSHTHEGLRAATYDIAEAIAPTWVRRRREIELVARPVREWMLRALAPAEGETVIELAAGAGDTGFDAATIIGERGRLITTDFSPAMLEAARHRGAERGIHNVEYLLVDAEEIELAGDSVDGALCRFGYMLMADPAAALAETRRVLRPGGRLVLAVWADPGHNPMFTTIASSLVGRGYMPPPDPPPAPGIFSMATPELITALLHGAGFSELRTEEVGVRVPLPGAEEYVGFMADTAGPLGLALQELSGEARAAVTSDVVQALRGFETGDGYVLPGLALCAVAR